MTDAAWIDLALRSARPRAVGALLRYFGNLDTAEEAFQEACLAALSKWPENGPPRDVAAWLIFVGPQRRPRRRPPPRQGTAAAGRGRAVRHRRRRERAGRAARRRALPRRHPSPAVRLLPSRAAVDAADRPRVARRLRVDRQGDRARVPGRRDGDGAADHPRQGAHRRRRDSVRDARARRARRPPADGRGDDLPRVQRGLLGDGRRGAAPRPALRRGDPAGPPAAAPVPRRAGDHGSARAAALAARARGRAPRRRRRDRAAGRSGPGALGSPGDQ